MAATPRRLFRPWRGVGEPDSTQVRFPLSLPLSHPEPIEGHVELIMVFGYNLTV